MNAQDKPSHWLETCLNKLSLGLQSEPQNLTELREILRHANKRKLMDTDALRMIEGVLNVSKLQARDIMVPRSQMVMVQQEQAPEEFIPFVIESTHSRFPVIGDDKDDVIGILHAKDMLRYFMGNEQGDFHFEEFIRPAMFIPESKHLDILLREFRTSRSHLAIVVDEYGGIAGLVTIEDVLEEIVGEIEDEFDTTETLDIKELQPHVYTVDASTEINDFNAFFQSDFSDKTVDTIGGLVTQAIGRVPIVGEEVVINEYYFKVTTADARHIIQLEVTLHDQAAPNTDTPNTD